MFLIETNLYKICYLKQETYEIHYGYLLTEIRLDPKKENIINRGLFRVKQNGSD